MKKPQIVAICLCYGSTPLLAGLLNRNYGAPIFPCVIIASGILTGVFIYLESKAKKK